MTAVDFTWRRGIQDQYSDILTPAALQLLQALHPLVKKRDELMTLRLKRRQDRALGKAPALGFAKPDEEIAGTNLTVAAARAGQFKGAAIPKALQRQWIQGTGPATRPGETLEKSLRNVAYALLSGADGWMFDGEDALGQVACMSLDNIRNLKLAVVRDPRFLAVAETVAVEMNQWAKGFLGREIIANWREQLDFTVVIYRARGLHLDDRHCRVDGNPMPASFADAALFLANCSAALLAVNRPLVLYLPKIQTGAEAALWNEALALMENQMGWATGTIKAYVLVEQLEATFQLMEIRAALGEHFVGFNTGRWDYINSVADALQAEPLAINPNIDAITMTFSYMAAYEDRVRRAVNTPDQNGGYALWQGGMEPNIPVGSTAGVEKAMAKAVTGAKREQAAGASGKWVAHWKMVHIVRPVWADIGAENQLGRSFPPLDYDDQAAKGLKTIGPGPRTIGGARDLISVALQYGNAFLSGYQAAALKPADFFGNDDVLYLMEDMATGEIRFSILWEWLHKGGPLTEAELTLNIPEGTPFNRQLFELLLAQEFEKLQQASNRDVHDHTKTTTLPVVREILFALVTNPCKAPWYIDLLNLNIGVTSVSEAKKRIEHYFKALTEENIRVTANIDYE